MGIHSDLQKIHRGLEAIIYSMKQAKIFGNDYRRELDGTLNYAAEILGTTIRLEGFLDINYEKPKIRDWVAYRMRNTDEWKIIQWADGWDEEIQVGGFIQEYRIIK
jgi:hypothetical protein